MKLAGRVAVITGRVGRDRFRYGSRSRPLLPLRLRDRFLRAFQRMP